MKASTNIDTMSRRGTIQDNPSHELFIPIETDYHNRVTGIFILDLAEYAESIQKNLFDITGSYFREGLSGLTVHRAPLDQSLQKGYIATLLKLARSIDESDEHTRFHRLRTAIWVRHLSQELGLSEEEVNTLVLAAKLHDVGKVMVPKEILLRPDHLLPDEWDMMKRHPNFGAVLMEPSVALQPVIPAVRAHHENYDGSGYPAGLAGDAIPFGARILSVADAFTTMTDGRVYRRPCSIHQAVQELERCSGTQFDPLIVEAILALIYRGDIEDLREYL